VTRTDPAAISVAPAPGMLRRRRAAAAAVAAGGLVSLAVVLLGEPVSSAWPASGPSASVTTAPDAWLAPSLL
jgi:hypothetical protein